MKKSILLLVVSMFLFVGCKNEVKKVETSPAKFTLTVINHTDQDMKWEQSWAMTGPDSGVVAAGDTVELSSNEVDSDHINVYPIPPKSIEITAVTALFRLWNSNWKIAFHWGSPVYVKKIVSRLSNK